MNDWKHPGGKLIELGSQELTAEELVTILIGTGYKDRTAADIAKELFDTYYSLYGLLGKTPADLSKIKGLKKSKIKRITAPYEIVKRLITRKGTEHIYPTKKITLVLPDLSDAELLAVLIGSGYKDKSPEDLAEELLKKFKSLDGFWGKDMSDITEIEGLGDVKAVRIAAAYGIVNRLYRILMMDA
ncbi:MAG: UPF0758 domain-containing protein [bacterium]